MSVRKNISKKCRHDYSKFKITSYSSTSILMDGTVYIEDYSVCSKCGKQQIEKKWTSKLTKEL